MKNYILRTQVEGQFCLEELFHAKIIYTSQA